MNAGLRPYWPYCNAARQITSTVMSKTDWSEWDEMKWRRRLETFGDDDSSSTFNSLLGADIESVTVW